MWPNYLVRWEHGNHVPTLFCCPNEWWGGGDFEYENLVSPHEGWLGQSTRRQLWLMPEWDVRLMRCAICLHVSGKLYQNVKKNSISSRMVSLLQSIWISCFDVVPKANFTGSWGTNWPATEHKTWLLMVSACLVVSCFTKIAISPILKMWQFQRKKAYCNLPNCFHWFFSPIFSSSSHIDHIYLHKTTQSVRYPNVADCRI